MQGCSHSFKNEGDKDFYFSDWWYCMYVYHCVITYCSLPTVHYIRVTTHQRVLQVTSCSILITISQVAVHLQNTTYNTIIYVTCSFYCEIDQIMCIEIKNRNKEGLWDTIFPYFCYLDISLASYNIYHGATCSFNSSTRASCPLHFLRHKWRICA